VGRLPPQGRAAQRLFVAARAANGEDVGNRRPRISKPLELRPACTPISFVTTRPDECCGFGGTFSVSGEPVSAKMGYDKVADHHAAGAEYIVSADMSCLMHQKGCAERLNLPIKFIHISQILNGARE
jgi:L-lactate dehydrogenase complex protein LldE